MVLQVPHDLTQSTRQAAFAGCRAAALARRLVVAAAVVYATGGVLFLGSAAAGRRDEARILLPPLPTFLGSGSPNSLVSGRFEIKNVGHGDLDFELSAGCACSQLEPRRGTIEPGESAWIRVGIQLPGAPGPTKSVPIEIRSNDPRI